MGAGRLEKIHLVAGSHNEESNLKLCTWMAEMGLEPSDKRVSFAQLLGMSDPITFNLAAHGYNVAKYVPYGPIREAIPYLIRRAQENTSVAGQTSRELSLLREEQRRRKGLIKMRLWRRRGKPGACRDANRKAVGPPRRCRRRHW